MKAYPLKELYEEMAFERRRWCEEISRINRDLNGERKNIFDV
jgi:hypothetical protein